MKKIRLLLLIPLCAILAGCATARGPSNWDHGNSLGCFDFDRVEKAFLGGGRLIVCVRGTFPGSKERNYRVEVPLERLLSAMRDVEKRSGPSTAGHEQADMLNARMKDAFCVGGVDDVSLHYALAKEGWPTDEEMREGQLGRIPVVLAEEPGANELDQSGWRAYRGTWRVVEGYGEAIYCTRASAVFWGFTYVQRKPILDDQHFLSFHLYPRYQGWKMALTPLTQKTLKNARDHGPLADHIASVEAAYLTTSNLLIAAQGSLAGASNVSRFTMSVPLQSARQSRSVLLPRSAVQEGWPADPDHLPKLAVGSKPELKPDDAEALEKLSPTEGGAGTVYLIGEDALVFVSNEPVQDGFSYTLKDGVVAPAARHHAVLCLQPERKKHGALLALIPLAVVGDSVILVVSAAFMAATIALVIVTLPITLPLMLFVLWQLSKGG